MSDLLQAGAAMLSEKLQSDCSQAVVYRRGSQSVVWDATFGSALLKVSDGHGGLKIVRTDADFVGKAAGLDFGQGPTLPLRGDTVDVTQLDGVTVARFEVTSERGEPHFRRADQYGYLTRVHAKYTKNV